MTHPDILYVMCICCNSRNDAMIGNSVADKNAEIISLIRNNLNMHRSIKIDDAQRFTVCSFNLIMTLFHSPCEQFLH